jgi:DNA end-binding protein Ku
MPRALASLTLSFGLVSIPVRLYNAAEPAPGVRFRLLTPEGRRIRQQYVEEGPPPIEEPPAGDEPPAGREIPLMGRPGSEAARVATFGGRSSAGVPPAAPSSPTAAPPSRAAVVSPLPARTAPPAPAFIPEQPADTPDRPAVPAVARERLLKGFEFEKGRFVTFTPDELQALAAPRRDTIDIVAFVPEHAVDPIYHDKAYYLAPERRGAKPYALLLEALRQSRRSAIAKWAWRGKETIAEIRAAGDGLALQQLRYADEVRRIDDLHIELEPVGRGELALALQLVEQNAEARFDPERWVNEEQARLRAAIEQKVAGQRIVESEPPRAGESAQVIDLMQALRASLRRGLDGGHAPPAPRDADASSTRDSDASAPRGADEPANARKPARRASGPPEMATRTAKTGDAAPPRGPATKRRSSR